MSAIEIAIERIGIALHGVSQEIAETALTGLEGELARRLDTVGARVTRTDLADIALGPFTVASNIDATALRALIAQALSAHLLDRQPPAPAAGANPASPEEAG